VNKRMTITEVADLVGISPKTIVRWEKIGKVRRAKRDFRGWRIYEEEDLNTIRQYRETVVEV
jgi:DNA-binding transcriptional MerR regulator